MATVNNISLAAPLMAQLQGTADTEKRSTDEVATEAVRDYLRKHPQALPSGLQANPVESLVQQERRERLARG